MAVNDLLSWITSVLILMGTYFLIKKNRVRWLFNLSAQIVSIYLYYRLKLLGLFLVNIVFIVLSIVAYVVWRLDENTNIY